MDPDLDAVRQELVDRTRDDPDFWSVAGLTELRTYEAPIDGRLEDAGFEVAAWLEAEGLLRARITQLWQTRMLRYTKLTVADEIENALSYYQSTFLRQIPKLYAELEEHLPGQALPSFLRMGHWIGGDRDGNPNVGAATLKRAMQRQSEVALRHYLTELHELGAELSISARLARITPEYTLARPKKNAPHTVMPSTLAAMSITRASVSILRPPNVKVIPQVVA